jgi:hypothetical protein
LLGELEHLKIKTRLIDEKYPSGPTLVFDREEDTVWWKWNLSRLIDGRQTPEPE